MLGWNHSGFGVHHAVRLDADDLAGRENGTDANNDNYTYEINATFTYEGPNRCSGCGPTSVPTSSVD